MARIRADQVDLGKLGFGGPVGRSGSRRRKPGPGGTPGDLPDLSPGLVLVGLDVSSTRTGWARAVVGPRGECLVERCGLLKPKTTRRAWDRGAQTAKLASGVLAGLDPERTRVLVEWCEGRIRSRSAKAGGQNLPPLCHAQGMVWQQVVRDGFTPFPVGDSTWTARHGGGRSASKGSRAEWVRCHVPAYAFWAGKDSGGDVADAVGILCWSCAVARGEGGIAWETRLGLVNSRNGKDG